MTKLGDLFLIPEWTSDERDAVARLLSRLESIVLDLGQRIDTSGRVSSLSVGGGRVTTNSITFPNNREQLRFSPTTGSDYATIGSDVLKDGKEVFRINQNAVGGSIGLQAQMTSAFKRLVLHEDPALADRLQLDLQIGGAAGAKFTMGGEVEIHGGADGVTTVFNETGRDIDFRVEGDTATSLLVADAGLDAVQVGTTVAGAIADFRAAAIVFNEASADIDFRVESNGNANMLFVDGGADAVGVGTASPRGGLQIASSGAQWSSFNYGENLILKGASATRNTTIGIFDAYDSNPWAIVNSGGDLTFCQMPALGDSTTAPTLALVVLSDQTLRLASANSWTANGTGAVTISNLAPAGVGTATISKWLAITDNAGVVMYIPCFT